MKVLIHSSKSSSTHGSKRISEIVDLVVAVLLLVFPKGQVLLEELDDALGVAEVVLLQLVNLVESLLESLVGELASSLVVLHDLVVEDGEVESEAELDWVARGKRNLVSLIVGLECRLLDLLHEGTLGVLSDVAVVVADHFDEEGFGLALAGFGEHFLVDHVDHALAVCRELVLNLLLVVAERSGVFGELGVLLDGGNSAASSSLRRNQILEGD